MLNSGFWVFYVPTLEDAAGFFLLHEVDFPVELCTPLFPIYQRALIWRRPSGRAQSQHYLVAAIQSLLKRTCPIFHQRNRTITKWTSGIMRQVKSERV